MTIRPVDTQLVYQHAQRLQRADTEGQQGQTGQQQFASEMQKAVTHRQQIVQSSEDTEQGKLRNEREGNRQGEQRQSGRKRKTTADPNKAKDASRGHRLDIKV